MKKVNGKDIVSVSLSLNTSKALVSTIETLIREQSSKLQDALNNSGFNELQQKYFDEKQKIEDLESELNSNKSLLETLARTNGGNKDVNNLMRTKSHNDSKGKNKFRWPKEFEIVLKTEQRFMSYESLFEAMKKKYPAEVAALAKNTFWATRNMILKSIKAAKERIGAGEKLYANATPLIEYKELIGLREWTDDNFVPLPQYIKQFMYADKKAV